MYHKSYRLISVTFAAGSGNLFYSIPRRKEAVQRLNGNHGVPDALAGKKQEGLHIKYEQIKYYY